MSLVGVDKAQATVLTYNFQVGYGGASNLNFFKVNNSSLTGIGEEYIPVSDGRLYGFTVGGKEYNNLAGATALFYQGDFLGLQVSRSDYATSELIIPPDEPGGPLYIQATTNIYWSIANYRTGFSTWDPSVLSGYYEAYRTHLRSFYAVASLLSISPIEQSLSLASERWSVRSKFLTPAFASFHPSV